MATKNLGQVSGVIAITVGMALRYILCTNTDVCSVIEIIA